jgi:[acyl-carrier-protein] S-malonyltransferase
MRFGLLFPGQGAQAPGMGRALYDAFAEAREVFEAADEALGESIARVCFEGTADELALTENTQPAILTTSIAALRVLEAAGMPRPSAAAGHSLGEYSAHVAAGTIRFPDAVATVRSRGRFMQEAVPVGVGAMAAVLGLDAEVVDEICREAAGGRVVSAANRNSPGQIVIAGHVDAVERACVLASDRGARKAVALPVSAPFHCALMEPAAIRLREVLEVLPFEDPAYPVHANADGRAVAGPAKANRQSNRIANGEKFRDFAMDWDLKPIKMEAMFEFCSS